jgi:Asp/Glu/hydantoin racemase
MNRTFYNIGISIGLRKCAIISCMTVGRNFGIIGIESTKSMEKIPFINKLRIENGELRIKELEKIC